MSARSCEEIKDSLRQRYVEDDRPWLVGFSGASVHSEPVEEGVFGKKLADFDGHRLFLSSDPKYWPEQWHLARHREDKFAGHRGAGCESPKALATRHSTGFLDRLGRSTAEIERLRGS